MQTHGSHSRDMLAPDSENRTQTRIGLAFLITCLYMLVETAGGILFNSLALIADAGHMFSDAMALGVSWIAIRIGKRHANDRLTYGFTRSEIIAAFFNCIALWTIVVLIFYEAIQRIFNPAPVEGLGMTSVASVGLILNLAIAATLFPRRKENLNIKAAFLHVMSDTLGSVGAIIAGLLITWTHFFWIDPVVSILIGLLILFSSWALLRETVNILMEGVPKGLDVSKVESSIANVEGVCCVYDLHIWNISSKRINLSAHVVLSEDRSNSDTILTKIRETLMRDFGVSHLTIQIETSHDNKWNSDPRFCRPGTSCSGQNVNFTDEKR